MDFLGLFRRRGFSGTDRPDRLIGDDRIGEAVFAGQLEYRLELLFDDPRAWRP